MESYREKCSLLRNLTVNTAHERELSIFYNIPSHTYSMNCHNNPIRSWLLTTAVWYEAIKHLTAQVHMSNQNHHHSQSHRSHYIFIIIPVKQCHSPPRWKPCYWRQLTAVCAADFVYDCVRTEITHFSCTFTPEIHTARREIYFRPQRTCCNTHILAHV